MKSKNSKETAQAAIEYLVVFSAVLMVFASVTIIKLVEPSKEAAKETLYLSQARSAADGIAEAINTVYSNGRGAVRSVPVSIDCVWSLQLDKLKNALKITIDTSRGKENIESALYYKLEFSHTCQFIPSGVYTVIVEWPDDWRIPESIDNSAIASGKIYIYLGKGGT